jgi:peptidyl-prolyl cis-trans isomerase B (cyclophilin B)
VPTNQQRREAVKRKLERQQERRAEAAHKRRRYTIIAAVVAVVAIVVGGVGLSMITNRPAEPASAAQSAVTPANIPTEPAAAPKRPTALPATATCAYPAGQPAAKPAKPPPTANISAQGTVGVTLDTNAGQIGLTLDRALAPCTVNSFVSLASQGYFDGTSCHRLTTSPGLQVLQCGDPTGQGSGGPGYTFADEVFPELTYGRGYLAMANGGPNTNGSQFFMIYGDAQLPPNYTVFGTISPDGLKVVDEVAKKGHDGSLDPSPGGGTPVTEVRIQKAAVAG